MINPKQDYDIVYRWSQELILDHLLVWEQKLRRKYTKMGLTGSSLEKKMHECKYEKAKELLRGIVKEPKIYMNPLFDIEHPDYEKEFVTVSNGQYAYFILRYDFEEAKRI